MNGEQVTVEFCPLHHVGLHIIVEAFIQRIQIDARKVEIRTDLTYGGVVKSCVRPELDGCALFPARKYPGVVHDICAPVVRADLACCKELIQNGFQLQSQPGFVVTFMQLVDVDVVSLQAAQAVLHVAADIVKDLLRSAVHCLLFFVEP